MQPIQTKNVDMSTFMEFWARLAHFGQNGTSPAERDFFLCGNPDDLSATSQRPIFTKFRYEMYLGVLLMNPERHFRKFSL